MRVAKNLNYERKSRYVLTVRAEDCAGDIGSGETRYDTAELTIVITDINDNPPTFLDSPYLACVMENVIPPNGGYVITVKAYDADTPPFNSQVRYFLKEGDADLFRINASTGEISLLRALDRESQAEYTLTLVAMDTGKLFHYFILLYFFTVLSEHTFYLFNFLSIHDTNMKRIKLIVKIADSFAIQKPVTLFVVILFDVIHP